MPNWMWDTKRKDASVVKKETHRIDLPETGFLSSIFIRLSATNGTTDNQDNHLHDCVPKIEVVGAGGETLKSISGVQAQVLNWLDKGSVMRHQLREDAAYSNIERWLINFGKHYMDTEHMLDCSKIIDGQLKITWDLSAVRAVNDATAFKDQNATLAVVYAIPQNWAGPAPKGYIKSTETKAWTTDSSGIEYVKIPRNNPIRRIIVRSFEEGIGVADNLTNLRLNADNGKVVPFDDTVSRLIALNVANYKPISDYMMIVRAADGDTKTSHVGYSKHIDLGSYGQRLVWCRADTYDKITIGVSDLATPTLETSPQIVFMNATGWAFHNSVCLPFDKPVWNDDMLLQAQDFGALDLELTQGNEGGLASVVTEEVVRQA